MGGRGPDFVRRCLHNDDHDDDHNFPDDNDDRCANHDDYNFPNDNDDSCTDNDNDHLDNKFDKFKFDKFKFYIDNRGPNYNDLVDYIDNNTRRGLRTLKV